MGKVVLALLLVACLALSTWAVASLKGSQTTVGGYVISTWVWPNGNDGGYYYVSIQKDDGKIEVFEETQSIVFNKYNTDDLYAQLTASRHAHQHVFVTVAGWHNTFWSTNRNIIKINDTIT